MAKLRNKGIIAYGTDVDREKLSVIAELSCISASEWLINKIRESYRESFGDADPSSLRVHH